MNLGKYCFFFVELLSFNLFQGFNYLVIDGSSGENLNAKLFQKVFEAQIAINVIGNNAIY